MGLLQAIFGVPLWAELTAPPEFKRACKPVAAPAPKDPVGPLVKKVAEAIMNKKWVTTWKQNKGASYADFLFGEIDFKAQPENWQPGQPYVTCCWHPKRKYTFVDLYNDTTESDVFCMQKYSQDLTKEEKEFLQNVFLTFLPDEIRNAPEEKMDKEIEQAIEKYL